MAQRRVLILGAGGRLGRKVGEVFGARSWKTIGTDPFSKPSTHEVLHVDASAGPAAQEKAMLKQLQNILGKGKKVDAVLNMAGGFAIGDASTPEVVESTVRMVESSVYSSIIATSLAGEVLRTDGLLVLPGAAAAFGPVAWSLPYGTAKAAVHHLVSSLSDPLAAGLPDGVKTIGIAPAVLDTPENRGAMPDADFGTFPKLKEVSEQLEAWSCNPSSVNSGHIYAIEKASGKPATFHERKPL
eukprot:NODE_15944_length_1020_cov_8.333707.p1 GENE.NODE_15944_length_1020_cov_8.333707~~NODE_15944_length_1020_cov_8.333707.p1  ORF type:complete len:242 (-),score=75.31 NODE_15944_length_1020_cov_8.333707:189-914(-)